MKVPQGDLAQVIECVNVAKWQVEDLKRHGSVQQRRWKISESERSWRKT